MGKGLDAIISEIAFDRRLEGYKVAELWLVEFTRYTELWLTRYV